MYNLCQFIEEIHNKYIDDVMWITGDFNLPNIDWNLNSITSNTYPLDICNMLIDVLSIAGFSQLVTTPTRGHNILDLFATNRPSLIKHLNVISGVSDHEIIKVESSLSAVIVQHKPRKVYLWNRANFTNINESMSTFSNSFVQRHNIDTPIQELWNIFKAQCENTLNSIPTKSLSRSHSTKRPWITSAIKRLSNKKKRLYTKARSSNSETDWSAYKEIKKLAQRESRKAHDSYVSNLISSDDANCNNNNKRLWSYIKSKRKDQCGIPSLEKDNQTITDSFCKATILNNQFQSVFTDANSTPTVTLKENAFPHIPPINITTDGVLQLLQELDPHKASGPDGIPSKFLRETSVSIAPALTLIYQASLHQGELPSDWKKAYVTPVYKKGPRTNPSNYRPISLTCICCKLLEHIIYSAISSHANDHNIMCTNQHGFRKKRSCETQLLETINDLTSALDAGHEVDVLFLDFSKAFDRVSHNCLLHKLLHYGINGSVHNWITNFLSDRSQQVILDNCHSNPCKVSSGVPQGSVLGPLLFLLYINDLSKNITSTIRLYADDTVVYRIIHSTDDIQKLQEDLNTLYQWTKDWFMLFNISKCEHLAISNKRLPLSSEYKIDDIVINKVASAKYLGVTITQNLSWKEHITKISNKANSTRGFLQRNLRQCSIDVKSLAYVTYVRPIVEYASVVWSPHTQALKNLLEMVQRKAARFVFNSFARNSSVTALLEKLNWSTLENRRNHAKVTMFYKIINDIVSVDFSHHLQPSSLMTRGHSQRFIPISTRVNSYHHSFLPSVIRMWNSLPIEVVTVNNVDDFKTKLLHTCTQLHS